MVNIKIFCYPKLGHVPIVVLSLKSSQAVNKCNSKGGGCGKYFCWVCLEVKSKITWDCGSYNEYCGKIAQPQTFD